MEQLRSGIPELDRMIDLTRPFVRDVSGSAGGGSAKASDYVRSIAVLGPDGTGKSVLGLHYLSTYFALSEDALAGEQVREGATTTGAAPAANRPTILYVSTDLRHSMALRVWRNFQLGYPWTRELACERESDRRYRIDRDDPGEIELTLLKPNEDSITDFLAGLSGGRKVGFLDLASNSAGDDWSYVSRLLSTLEEPTNAFPHLVVLDSIAGFETLVGERDAYGERATRRGRVAQIMRAAQPWTHLILIVEETVDGARQPEEFVVDTVIRLRRQTVGGAIRRTLEIEKSRGGGHATGEHPYRILAGRGSSTGIWENPDSPRTVWHGQVAPKGRGEPETSAYVQIYPSLQHRNSRVRSQAGIGKPQVSGGILSLGIAQLDEMLPGGDEARREGGNVEPARGGLPAGRVSSLIGAAGTSKSSIAESFLCDAFLDYARSLVRLTAEMERPRRPTPDLLRALQAIARWRHRPTDTGAADVDLPDRFTRRAVPRTAVELDAARRAALDHRGNAVDDSHADYTWYGEKYLGRLDRRAPAFDQQWLEPSKPEKTSKGAKPGPPLRRLQYPAAWSTRAARPFDDTVELADWVLRHPAHARPAVLISTRDLNGQQLIEQFAAWLSGDVHREIREAWPTAGSVGWARRWEQLRPHLLTYIDHHLIYRRLETSEVTSSMLFHIVEWTVMESQRMVFGPVLPREHVDRFAASNRIRVVLDDFRILRDTYPAVDADPLFLPFLTLYLEREGVTSLIVDTDSGRPDKDPRDKVNRELRSLVAQQLYTWQVPFFGQSRIAITAVPASSPNHLGIVREVAVEPPHASGVAARPTVNPHFELYSGFEEGDPKPVSLEVKLFAETPAFAAYIEEERLFFRQLFSADSKLGDGAHVVVGAASTEYETLRDFCQMPNDLRLDHSLIFQVDNYWNQRRRGSLLPLYRYLTEPTTVGGREAPLVDPFRLFQPIRPRERLLGDARDGKTVATDRGRMAYFEQRGYYRHRVDLEGENASIAEKRRADRVPFMWDFGFLLCNADAWKAAGSARLRDVPGGGAAESGKPTTVGDVWKSLRQAEARTEFADKDSTVSKKPHGTAREAKDGASSDGSRLLPADWRQFFEAAQIVAETAQRVNASPVRVFSIETTSSEGISCLVLEIWLSEIWKRVRAEEDDAGRRRLLKFLAPEEYLEPTRDSVDLIELLTGVDVVTRDSEPRTEKLFENAYKAFKQWHDPKAKNRRPPGPQPELPGYSLELYKTWLLLLEVLDFSEYENPDRPFGLTHNRTESRPPAVAVRHWYKTACAMTGRPEQADGNRNLWQAVRLPGAFTVRGDWHLAAAKGSRSSRLAERALDILSSRRANMTRLELGLGLPTRDIIADDQVGKIRTALRVPDALGAVNHVTYGDLCDGLAARHAKPTEFVDGAAPASEDFYWLWRGGLRGYDRHSRPFRKWLQRFFAWTSRYVRKQTSDWDGGFTAYDEMSGDDFRRVVRYPSFEHFAHMCDLLVAGLQSATLQSDDAPE